MAEKIRIAVLGYGNVGKYAVAAVQAAPDMELAGIVERDLVQVSSLEAQQYNLVNTIDELSAVDVALLCIPTRSVPEVAASLLARGINTVDAYDIHGQLADLRLKLNEIAISNHAVAVISAGWDPGSDSMIRGMFDFMLPHGITYTNFGPGMSMGHTTAIKSIPGVANALALTIPVGTGIHRRMVYVQLKPGADFNQIAAAIKNDPYFADDDTIVRQVLDVDMLLDMGHGVSIERKGVAGATHNQLLSYSMKINNPALTSQIMVAAARAGMKQKPGAYTMLQIPVIDFIYGDPDEIIRQLV